MQIHASNPTDFAQTRWIRYGAERHPHNGEDALVLLLPDSLIAAARVHVPAHHNGPVEREPIDPAAAFLHPSVHKAIVDGLEIFLRVGHIGEEELVQFIPSDWVQPDGDYRVLEWTARGEFGTGKLITYLGKGDPLMDFEVAFFAESKGFLRGSYRVNLEIKGAACLSILGMTDGALVRDESMIDAQGVRRHGCFLFGNAGVDADDSSTIMANLLAPLGHGIVQWDKWGIFGRKPRQIEPERVYDFMRHSAAFLADGFDFLPADGINKRPGNTGHQPGFGHAKHQVAIGLVDARVLEADRYNAEQEACRPNHFFEDDGSIFISTAHPFCVMWDGVFHYNKGISPDQLGRDPNRGGLNTATDWFPHDFQHECANWLSGDAILGSVMSRKMLLMKTEILLASLTTNKSHPGYSTNAPLAGRALGRTGLVAAQIFLATGDARALVRMQDMIEENLLPWMKDVGAQFTAVSPMGTEFDACVTRLFPNDRHTFGAGSTSWMVWEDGLAFMGLHAMANAFALLGSLSETVNALVGRLGNTLILLGFSPIDGQIAKAILWEDKHGDGLKKYRVPHWEKGDEAVHRADGTDYRTWARDVQVTFANGPSEPGEMIEAKQRAMQILSEAGPVPFFLASYDA